MKLKINLMSDYANLIAKQKQQLQEQLARLEQADLSALEAKKAKLLKEVEEVDTQIAAIVKELGISVSSEKTAAGQKAQGILVSYNRLLQLFEEHKTSEINLRALRLDTKQIKKLVADNPDKLELAGKGAWPIVKLKK